jgi:hypothetical protein
MNIADNPYLHKTDVSKRISSYQKRIEDLQFAWELLHKIGDLQLQRMDGLKDEQFFKKFEKIVYEEIYQRDEEEFNECPLCGLFRSHHHSL